MQSALPASHFRALLLLGGLALGLGLVPPAQVTKVRTHLLDALKPGLVGLQALDARWKVVRQSCALHWPQFHPEDHTREIEQLAVQLAAAKHRARQLELANAQIHRQLEQMEKLGPNPYPTRPGQPLVEMELLEAAVLNRQSHSIWQPNRILNRGSDDGLADADLVLEGNAPLIDQGQNEDLSQGHPVYAGRSVVGRLANVGRTVSTIQTVTDENYRGFAQLVRKTEQGFVFGAEGVIEGQGEELCRLRYVASTQPVEVGDAVYTGNHDGSQPFPMYYGQVVRAELHPGDQEWSIWVEPAVSLLKTPTVTVLRTQLDAARTLTN